MIIFDEAFEAAHEALKLNFYAYVTYNILGMHDINTAREGKRGRQICSNIKSLSVSVVACDFISFFLWSFSHRNALE